MSSSFDDFDWFVRDVRECVEHKPSSVLSRVKCGWGWCLRCGALLPDGSQARYSGLCAACHHEVDAQSRGWYWSMVERWRNLNRKRLKMFERGPDPWQVTLYALGRLMLGFGTAPGMEGTERAGLDEVLGETVATLQAAMRGRIPLSQQARDRLVLHGPRLVRMWSRA
jgi:hypothetical protein